MTEPCGLRLWPFWIILQLKMDSIWTQPLKQYVSLPCWRISQRPSCPPSFPTAPLCCILSHFSRNSSIWDFTQTKTVRGFSRTEVEGFPWVPLWILFESSKGFLFEPSSLQMGWTLFTFTTDMNIWLVSASLHQDVVFFSPHTEAVAVFLLRPSLSKGASLFSWDPAPHVQEALSQILHLGLDLTNALASCS